jgi:hypothetical protein
MLDAGGEMVERALGMAVRVLEERIDLCRRLAARARGAGLVAAASSFERQGHEAMHRMQTILAATRAREVGE